MRERITIVHAHSAFSTLAHEALLTATIMKIHVSESVVCSVIDLQYKHTDSIHRALALWFWRRQQYAYKHSSALHHLNCRPDHLCLTHKVCDNTCRLFYFYYPSKENMVLRSHVEPDVVSVIPNAVDASRFTPDQTNRDEKFINIVVVSRYADDYLHQILHRYSCSLVLRKGVGLLAPVIERVCSAVPGARFIIGGDGPLRLLIEETRDKYNVCSQ